jgi:hypothetical protein
LPLLSSRRGSGWRSRKSVWNSPSFLSIIFPPARTGRAFRGNGPNGSIKGSPSFSVSEQDLRNASDADVFRLTNANLRIQAIEPGAGDQDRGIGSVEFARSKAPLHSRTCCKATPKMRCKQLVVSYEEQTGARRRQGSRSRPGGANCLGDYLDQRPFLVNSLGRLELGAVDRQLPDPLSRCREDRVGDRRHHGRRTRLTNAPRSLRALD